jgi:hypothetical protein
MYSNYWITQQTIHGLSCEVRIYISPSLSDGETSHSVIGSVVLCALPQLLLVNEVKLNSVNLEPGLDVSQVKLAAHEVISHDDLVERAGYTLQMLQNLYADHLGVPDRGIRDRISI